MRIVVNGWNCRINLFIIVFKVWLSNLSPINLCVENMMPVEIWLHRLTDNSTPVRFWSTVLKHITFINIIYIISVVCKGNTRTNFYFHYSKPWRVSNHSSIDAEPTLPSSASLVLTKKIFRLEINQVEGLFYNSVTHFTKYVSVNRSVYTRRSLKSLVTRPETLLGFIGNERRTF